MSCTVALRDGDRDVHRLRAKREEHSRTELFSRTKLWTKVISFLIHHWKDPLFSCDTRETYKTGDTGGVTRVLYEVPEPSS